MNGDSNFKTIVYNNGQKYKSAFIEKVLRENLMTNSSSSSSKIDDTKLMHLNKILSNLTYETLKRLNDKNESDKMAKNVFNTLNAATATTTAASSSSGGSSSSNGNETKNTKPSGLSTPSTIKSDINNKKVLNSLKIERIKSSKIQPASSSSEQSNNNEIINLANSSQIVIHVCDEARRLKQDFTCPRDLLVREMKYFSYNLNINVSNTSQSTSGAHAHSSIPTSALSKKSLDEIDISVHCDINIFDWLMRYVKRNHPFLIEKTIASPPSVQDIINDTNNTTATNNHHHPPASKVYEPKLEVNNCVSILLSSDFLIMGDLVDKCIVFIAQNLESVLQIQCVLNGISDYIITKLAACVHAKRLDTIYDKKDKLKTKLFQRKIEFLFDVNKYKSQFESSTILNNWKYDRTNNSPPTTTTTTTTNKIKDNNKKQFSIDSTDQSLSNHLESSDLVDQQTDLKDDSSTTNQQQQQQQLDNYTNYLYECENDASTLFKCKLCSKLMTKQQSLNLKCQLAILNSNGDYIYLHVPDEQFDMTNLLRLLKEKLKTWQSVYWFLWSLIKSFKCRKCNQWFRLTDLNRCRLNEQTYCLIHDGRNNFVYTKNSASNTINNSNSTELSSSSGCTCIHINHIMETSSFTNLYANSSICTDDTNSTQLTSEQRLARYLDNIMEDLDKHSDIIFHGRVITNTNKDLINEHYSICDLIEDFIQTDKFKNYNLNTNNNTSNSNNNSQLSNNSTNIINPLINSRILKLLPKTPIEIYECGFFIDSITGKHITLLDKHVLNLIKLSQLTANSITTTLTNATGSDLQVAKQNINSETQISPNNTAGNNNGSGNNNGILANTSSSIATTTTTTATSGANNTSQTLVNMINNNATNNNNSVYNINGIVNTSLDLKTFIFLVNFMDVRNVFNCLDALHFLRITNKMKWDCSKPIRFNQDNQREDDLKKFREISNYLIRAKLIDEYQKPPAHKSSITNLLMQQQQNTSNLISSPGGMYCRIESQWKIRI